MSACLLATCTLLGVGAAAVAEQQEQAQKEAVEQFLKVANSPDPMGLQRQVQDARNREIEAKALRPGQRCMQGRRLERIEGGWRDLPHEPC